MLNFKIREFLSLELAWGCHGGNALTMENEQLKEFSQPRCSYAFSTHHWLSGFRLALNVLMMTKPL
jgi:hypothetical protein